LSYGDVVKVRLEDDVSVFEDVVRRGGHSTYRIYANSDRRNPDVMKVIQTLEKMHCDMENATDKIVGVDVLPEADIYAVYKVLEDAERTGILEFLAASLVASVLCRCAYAKATTARDMSGRSRCSPSHLLLLIQRKAMGKLYLS
jgi:Domain of unknown function (DUF4265)